MTHYDTKLLYLNIHRRISNTLNADATRFSQHKCKYNDSFFYFAYVQLKSRVVGSVN